MIKITYTSREPPMLLIQGHSGYSTEGTDIVCAAVSTLFLTLVNSLHEMANDLVSVRNEPGDGSIIWRSRVSETGKILLEGCLVGLKSIAETYPENVQFTTA